MMLTLRTSWRPLVINLTFSAAVVAAIVPFGFVFFGRSLRSGRKLDSLEVQIYTRKKMRNWTIC